MMGHSLRDISADTKEMQTLKLSKTKIVAKNLLLGGARLNVQGEFLHLDRLNWQNTVVI